MKISNFKFQISNKYQLPKIGNFLQSKAGFTLIELMVSIGILAILSTFIIMAVDPYTQFQKAQDAKRKSDLSQIQKALEAYYQDNGRYPSSSVSGTNMYKIVTGEPSPQNVKDWGAAWTPYIQVLPKDVGGRNYIYYVADTDTGGQTYYLYAALERKNKDPNVCKPNSSSGGPCDNAPVDCGSAVCNYGVSSTNVSP